MRRAGQAEPQSSRMEKCVGRLGPTRAGRAADLGEQSSQMERQKMRRAGGSAGWRRSAGRPEQPDAPGGRSSQMRRAGRCPGRADAPGVRMRRASGCSGRADVPGVRMRQEPGGAELVGEAAARVGFLRERDGGASELQTECGAPAPVRRLRRCGD